MAIQAELRLGIRDFKSNLDRATNDVRKSAGTMRRETEGIGAGLGKGFKGAGRDIIGAAGLGGGVVGIGMAMKSALDGADDIADLTLKLQESAESIQKVGYAAKLSGTDVEQVAGAMIKLERALGDVENTKAAAALAHLGFSAESISKMSLDEKMIALSEAFQKARAEGTGVNDIQALLGKSASELIPLLEQGGDALRGMFEDAPALAESTVQEMAKVNDAIDGMIMRAKSGFASLVGAWTGANQFASDFIANMMGGNGIGEAWTNAQGQRADRNTEADFDARDRAAAREKQGKAQSDAAAAAAAAASTAKAEEDAMKRADQAEEEILKRREKAEAERAQRAKELKEAREQAEAGGFALLTPEQQAARLMEQLEGSLGIDVKGMKDVDAGLAKQRKAVEDARASGDTEAEKAALDKLSESQRLAKEFTTAASDLAPNAPDGGVGSLAGLVNQMFGRDPQAQQVDEIRKGNELTKQVKEGIDKVITKMDEQPPPIAFTRL